MRTIKVITTVPLDDALRKKVEAFFISRLGESELRFEYSVDGSLLGGIKAIDGDKIYDGTLVTQLEKMKRSIV